jgi:hypothetical protein
VRRLLVAGLAAIVAAAPAGAATIKGTPRADRVAAHYNFMRDNVACGAGADLVNADLSDNVARDCELVVRRLSRDRTGDFPAQHETQVEPDSLAWGKTVVVAFQSGRHPNGGAAATGWSTSKNAGETWTGGFLGRAAERVSDPVVAYDATHRTWLIAELGINQGVVDILLSRSPDGIRWSRPVTAVSAPAPNADYDKEWLVCDNGTRSPYRGRCYLSYLDLGTGTIATRFSEDAGLTWSSPVSTSAGTPSGSLVQGAFPVVRPDGTLVVLFNVNAPIGGRGLDWIAAATSTDGAATFAPPVRVADVDESDPLGVRAPVLVSADVDATGRIYVAWSDCRFHTECTAADIVLATSANGSAWTAPSLVTTEDPATRTDHFLPGLVVEPVTRRVAIAYYSLPQPNGCALDDCPGIDVSLTESRDGGATWGAARRLNAETMPLAWLADGGLGKFVGDYISASYAGGRPIAAVAIAVQPPDPVALRQAIFAIGYPPVVRR